MKRLILILCLVLLFLPSNIAFADEKVQWEKAESGTTKGIIDVAWGKDKFVAVGNGFVLSSDSKGLKWKKIYENKNYNFDGVVYGNEHFIAYARAVEKGKLNMLISDDGVTWEENTLELEPLIWELKWLNNQFVGVGSGHDGGVVITSADGENWSWKAIKGVDTLHNVFYENNEYIATGNRNLIFVSKDGIEWTKRKVPEKYGMTSGIAYGSAGYVVVGDFYIYLSKDFKKWTLVKGIEPDFKQVVVTDNGYFALSQNMVSGKMSICNSKNGKKWNVDLKLPSKSNYINCLRYYNNRLILVGEDGAIYIGRTNNVIDKDKALAN